MCYNHPLNLVKSDLQTASLHCVHSLLYLNLDLLDLQLCSPLFPRNKKLLFIGYPSLG